MYFSISDHLRYMVRPLSVVPVLCSAHLCRANDTIGVDQQIFLSQATFDFGDLSPTSIAVIAAISIAILLILVWVVKKLVGRSRLDYLRERRTGTSDSEGSGSDSTISSRARPEKTEVVRIIVIGSEDDVDVRFREEGVSSRHAELLVLRAVDSSPLLPLEPIYYLRDMASTRGTEVFRDGNWMRFRADVVLDDEQLRIGEVETTAHEINRLAIELKVAANAEDSSPH